MNQVEHDTIQISGQQIPVKVFRAEYVPAGAGHFWRSNPQGNLYAASCKCGFTVFDWKRETALEFLTFSTLLESHAHIEVKTASVWIEPMLIDHIYEMGKNTA